MENPGFPHGHQQPTETLVSGMEEGLGLGDQHSGHPHGDNSGNKSNSPFEQKGTAQGSYDSLMLHQQFQTPMLAIPFVGLQQNQMSHSQEGGIHSVLKTLSRGILESLQHEISTILGQMSQENEGNPTPNIEPSASLRYLTTINYLIQENLHLSALNKNLTAMVNALNESAQNVHYLSGVEKGYIL
jgi:hypothetical protein